MYRYILLCNYVQVYKITTIKVLNEYENIHMMHVTVKAHYCHRFTHS
jgi:hypothetical protein